MGWRRRPRGPCRLPRRRGRQAALNRGEIYDVELPGARRPVVIVTRDGAIPVLANVTVAAVTATIRDLPTEVPVGEGEGLARESVINCDNLFTIPKSSLGRRRGQLGPESLERLRSALLIALDLEGRVPDV
jgi:mRNA interferase MazF